MPKTPWSAPDADDTTDKPRDEFTRDISQVIEKHGEGLNARAISTTLDDLSSWVEDSEGEEDPNEAAEVTDGDGRRTTRELHRELAIYIETHYGGERTEMLLAALRELADDLRDGSLRPDVEYDGARTPQSLTLTYASAFALERALPTILDAGRLFIETDVQPNPVEGVAVQMTGPHIDDRATLHGRIVRSAPSGLALQLFDLDDRAREALTRLPRRMRKLRREQYAHDSTNGRDTGIVDQMKSHPSEEMMRQQLSRLHARCRRGEWEVLFGMADDTSSEELLVAYRNYLQKLAIFEQLGPDEEQFQRKVSWTRAKVTEGYMALTNPADLVRPATGAVDE